MRIGLFATQLQLSEELHQRLNESFNNFSASLQERDKILKLEVSQVVEPLAKEMACIRAENRHLNGTILNLGNQVTDLGSRAQNSISREDIRKVCERDSGSPDAKNQPSHWAGAARHRCTSPGDGQVASHK